MATELTELSVSEPWFTALREGRKTVEGRLAKGRFAALEAGARLRVSGPPGAAAEALDMVVTRVARYDGFEAYLEAEGLGSTLPGVESVEAGVAVYRQFYPPEAEREHGVLAVHVAPRGG